MQQEVVEFMESLHLVLLVAQVVIAVSLIGFILIQHGKGADAGAAFGSGASSTVFGSQGSGNFLSKATAVLAFLFLSNSLVLGYMATQRVVEPTSIMDSAPAVVEEVITTDVPVMDTTESDIPAIPEE
jgi:preprotein translocase subunit SecG